MAPDFDRATRKESRSNAHNGPIPGCVSHANRSKGGAHVEHSTRYHFNQDNCNKIWSFEHA
jgi:hypothetical protein